MEEILINITQDSLFGTEPYKTSFLTVIQQLLLVTGGSGTLPDIDFDPSGLLITVAPGGSFAPPSVTRPSAPACTFVPAGKEPRYVLCKVVKNIVYKMCNLKLNVEHFNRCVWTKKQVHIIGCLRHETDRKLPVYGNIRHQPLGLFSFDSSSSSS